MPGPVNIYGPVTGSAITDDDSTEMVILTLSGVMVDTVQKTVTIAGVLNITTGTAGTAVVVTVRRGTTTSGTKIGDAITSTTTATDDYTIAFSVSDLPGESHDLNYVVTVTETSATGKGTVNWGAVYAIVSQ